MAHRVERSSSESFLPGRKERERETEPTTYMHLENGIWFALFIRGIMTINVCCCSPSKWPNAMMVRPFISISSLSLSLTLAVLRLHVTQMIMLKAKLSIKTGILHVKMAEWLKRNWLSVFFRRCFHGSESEEEEDGKRPSPALWY